MIDSEIFGQNEALEKPHGENQLEREKFYYVQQNIRIEIQWKFNLSPPKISSQNLEKRAQQSLENCAEK